MRKIPPLTSLRFFAASAIVAAHTLSMFFGLRWGWLGTGVSFFFVLSGFILTLVYRNFADRSAAEFYIARFARLWPLHILTLAVAIFLWPHSLETQPVILNALLLQSWFPLYGYPFSFNAVAWSISVEVFFYAVFPFMARSRHPYYWYAAVVMVTVAYLSLANLSLVSRAPSVGSIYAPHLAMQFPLARLLEFSTGVICGRLFLSTDETPVYISRHADRICICALLCITIWALTFHSYRTVTAIWLHQCGAQIFFAILIFVLAFGEGQLCRYLSHPVLVALGEMSFATYMIHQLILRAVQVQIKDPSGVEVIAIILSIYGASYFTWQVFEMPSRRSIVMLLRKLVQAKSRQPPQPADSN